MNAYEFHADGLRQLQEELGDDCPKFTWSGKEWTILPDSADCSKNLDLGGFKLGSRLSFTTLTSQFPRAPEAIKNEMLETEMIYQGEKWLIKLVSIAPTGKQLHIEAHQVSP